MQLLQIDLIALLKKQDDLT